MLSSLSKKLKSIKELTVFDTLIKLHEAESNEVNGKVPWNFYFWVIAMPVILAVGCCYKYPVPTDGFKSNIIQILAIVTGLLISSLVPFYELAASNVIADLDERKLSAINSLRIQLMIISYSVIIFSLMLSVFGIILCLITFVDFSWVNDFHLGSYWVSVNVKKLDMLIVFLFYSVLLINLANLFNIIKYTSSLVRPVLAALADAQEKEGKQSPPKPFVPKNTNEITSDPDGNNN